jgi:hypothetical protein
VRKAKTPEAGPQDKNDPFFLPAGAEAFKRDIPGADIRFFDTGHFALETHSADIAAAVSVFLDPIAKSIRRIPACVQSSSRSSVALKTW